MTTPSYTTDLTDIATGDESSGWVELTGTDGNGEAYNAQGAPAYEDNEYPYIQGSFAVTQDCTKNASVGSLAYSSGGITVTTGSAILVWHNFSSPFVMGTYAQGGMCICVGSGISDFDIFYVGGSDKGRMPYGGWQNHAVDPNTTPDDTVGTPTGTFNYVGSAVYVVSGPSKGEPHQVDALRYGRCAAQFEHGDITNGYATIAGFAAQNDLQANRWGLIQATPGGYLWKGAMYIGTATNAVNFVDSDVLILIDWTPKVSSSFNTIYFLNASSVVKMTGFQFICLDPDGTASRGSIAALYDADITLDGCSFIGMNNFQFDNYADVINCVFKTCVLVQNLGAVMTGCTFQDADGTIGSSYLQYNYSSDPDGHLDNCSFIAGSVAMAAINFGANCPSTITLRGIDFSGYNANDDQNDSTLYFSDTGSDVSWTVNLIGCSGNVSVRTARSGDTVTLVADPVTTSIIVKDLNTGNLLPGARVLVWPTNGINFPYQEGVTLSGSGTSASVSHTGHGLSTNDKVIIEGAPDDAYNGTFQITVTGPNTYTYTTIDTIVSTGISGSSTFAFVSGITNASGYISDSRVVASDQAISGRVRISQTTINSETVYLQQGVISGTIDSENGFSTTIQLVRDM